MFRIGSIFFCLLLMGSCIPKNQEIEKPADLLDKNKMAAVLTDITLMEAAANIKTQQNPSIKVDSVLKFNVYKQHLITRTQYESSLKYYSAKPSEFREVYEIVLQKINSSKTTYLQK